MGGIAEVAISEIGKKFDAMTVRSVSSDGRIGVKVHNRGDIVIFVKSDEAFARYTESSELATQVAGAMNSAVSKFEDGRQMLIAESQSMTIEGPLHWHSERRRMREELSVVRSQAVSPQRLVRIRSRGMKKFKIELKPEILTVVTSGQFAQEVNQTIKLLRQEHLRATYELKKSYVGDVGMSL